MLLHALVLRVDLLRRPELLRSGPDLLCRPGSDLLRCPGSDLLRRADLLCRSDLLRSGLRLRLLPPPSPLLLRALLPRALPSPPPLLLPRIVRLRLRCSELRLCRRPELRLRQLTSANEGECPTHQSAFPNAKAFDGLPG